MNQVKLFSAVILLSFSGISCVTLFSEIHTQHNHNVDEQRLEELEERLEELQNYIDEEIEEDEEDSFDNE